MAFAKIAPTTMTLIYESFGTLEIPSEDIPLHMRTSVGHVFSEKTQEKAQIYIYIRY